MEFDIRPIVFTAILLFVFFLTLVLSSCNATKTIPVVEYRDSIVYEHHWDTLIVYQRDSVDRYVSNDTIYLSKWVTKETIQIKHDTINSTKVDKVPYEVEVEKEVVPSWCWWLLAICGVFVLYKVGRFAIKVYTQGRV